MNFLFFIFSYLVFLIQFFRFLAHCEEFTWTTNTITTNTWSRTWTTKSESKSPNVLNFLVEKWLFLKRFFNSFFLLLFLASCSAFFSNTNHYQHITRNETITTQTSFKSFTHISIAQKFAKCCNKFVIRKYYESTTITSTFGNNNTTTYEKYSNSVQMWQMWFRV